eukprot:2368336-Pleurochrysis_carterae.AAC.3
MPGTTIPRASTPTMQAITKRNANILWKESFCPVIVTHLPERDPANGRALVLDVPLMSRRSRRLRSASQHHVDPSRAAFSAASAASVRASARPHTL